MLRNHRTGKHGSRAAALLSVLLTAAWMMLSILPAFAESYDSGTKQGYVPMHMAIILDSSGSVGSSKETLLNSRSGAACLASSVPLRENQVAVFSYSDRANDESRKLIKNGRLQPVIGLTPMAQYDKRSKVIGELNNMRSCSGGTALVYAIRDAAAYLKQHSDPKAKDVIVIFTDGEETEALSKALIAANPSLIDDTVKEALEGSDAKVYSIAYDHNGSITGADGGPGYGYQLLKRFEELSGGRVYDTGKISDLPKCFDEIIGEVCCLPFDDSNRLNIKADGGEHEKVIHVPQCVAEATIRISCAELNIIRDGKVLLFDEKGENVPLSQKGGENQKVWYTLDDLGATIKLRAPAAGDWKLRVSDMISDEDIRETWIMQYNMSAEFLPDDTEAYHAGENIKLCVALKSDGERITDPEIYHTDSSVNGLGMHAYVICSDGTALPADFGNPKSDEMLDKLMKLPNAKQYPLHQSALSDAYFTAVVPTEAAGSKLISVWIDSDYFYCYADKTVTVGEKIVEPLTLSLYDIEIEKGEEYDTELSPYIEKEYDSRYMEPDEIAGCKVLIDNNEIAEVVEKDGFGFTISGKKTGVTRMHVHYDLKDGTPVNDVECVVRVTNCKPHLMRDNLYYVETGETKVLSGVSGWFEDIEKSPMTVELVTVEDPDIADVSMDGDTLTLRGIKEGTAHFGLNVSNGMETERFPFEVEVTVSARDQFLNILPWIIGAVLLLIVIIIAAVIAAKKKHRLFITLKKAVYAECDSDGVKQCAWTFCTDMKLNAKLDCGEITLGKLMQKLAQMSMDPSVQQLAAAGASHRFAETCGIADNVKCKGGKNESAGVRFTGRSKNLTADGQLPGEPVEMQLRTEPGGMLGLIFRLSSGELTQIWLCTKDSTAGIDYTQKGVTAAEAWEKQMQQEQKAAETAQESAPAETANTGGWSSTAKPEHTGTEQPAEPEQKASPWGSGSSRSGSSWGSGSSGNSQGGGSSWGSGSSGNSQGGGSSWGSGSSGNAQSGGSSWGSGSSGNSQSGGSSWGSGSSGNAQGGGSSWGSGNSGKKW